MATITYTCNYRHLEPLSLSKGGCTCNNVHFHFKYSCRREGTPLIRFGETTNGVFFFFAEAISHTTLKVERDGFSNEFFLCANTKNYQTIIMASFTKQVLFAPLTQGHRKKAQRKFEKDNTFSLSKTHFVTSLEHRASHTFLDILTDEEELQEATAAGQDHEGPHRLLGFGKNYCCYYSE